MAIRRSATVLIAAGILLLVFAALVRFVLVPALSKMPAGLNVSIQYVGTGNVLNPGALQSGNPAKALESDVPVTVDRHIYVSRTFGDTAIVHDDITLKAPGLSLPVNHTYAIDRKTMDAAQPPPGTSVQPHSGMTIALPLHPKSSATYRYYDYATGSTVPMSYLGTGDVSGRRVLSYRAVAQGDLTDKPMSRLLPPVMPKSIVSSLAPLLPAALRQQLASASASLPDSVPFSYTAITTVGLMADATMGTPVSATLDQKIVADVTINHARLGLMPVLDVSTRMSQASVKSAASSAGTQSTELALISIWLPILLTVLGLGLIAVSYLRRR